MGKSRQIILALAQAGWHTSDQLEVTEGIYLEFMPSHSKELQPAERLWPLTNEAIANCCFQTLDELEEMLFHRCRVLFKQPEFIKAVANFHWWPSLAT